MNTFRAAVCTLLVVRSLALLYAGLKRKEVRVAAFLFMFLDALSLMAIWGNI